MNPSFSHVLHAGLEGKALFAYLQPLLWFSFLLFLIGVGVYARDTARNDRRILLVALAGGLVGGCAVGLNSVALPGVQLVRMASVLLLPLALLGARRVPPWLFILLTATFALFHGYLFGETWDTITRSVGHVVAYISGLCVVLLGGLLIGWYGGRAIQTAIGDGPTEGGAGADGYRLLLIVSLLLWSVGFVDLATHFSGNPNSAVLGLYALPVFAVLVAYSSLFFLLVGLLIVPRSQAWVQRGLMWIQDRWWAAMGILAVLFLLGWNIFTWAEWLEYPAFSLVIILFLCMAGGILVLYNWRSSGARQLWRRFVAYPVALLLLAELSLQVLAMAGALPGSQAIGSAHVQGGRVYQNVQGLGNGVRNSYGWYAPEFELNEDSERILLVGDSYLEALQIDSHENVGSVLEELLNESRRGQSDAASVEVLTMGLPGYGPGIFLDIPLLERAVRTFAPSEIIVFIEVGHDFQVAQQPEPGRLFFSLNDEGIVEIHPDDFGLRHTLQHRVLAGYDPPKPVQTIRSHYLTPQLLSRQSALWASDGDSTVAADPAETLFGESDILFAQDSTPAATEAITITWELLRTAYKFAELMEIPMRVVTIPAFPARFYQAYPESEWEPTVGVFDLFLPERVLAERSTEKQMPFLATGQFMHASDMAPVDIQALYFADGQGYLTPEGHAYLAEMIFNCFYAVNLPAGATYTQQCP